MADPSSLTDEVLFEEFARSNETQHFDEIVTRFKQKLFNFICRYTGDKELAEDILQDVFIKAYFNICKMKDFRYISAWMYKIAVNTSINHMRKKKTYPLSFFFGGSDDEGLELNIPDRSPLLEERILRAETEACVQQAIQRLPQIYRAVIVMHYISDLSLVEISEILEKPLGTVKSLNSRGREMLRKDLGPLLNE